MSPRPNTGKSESLHIAVSPDLLEALDAEAQRLTQEMKFNITRSDVARRWLEESRERVSKKKK